MFWVLLIILFTCRQAAELYCEPRNCYELLEVEQDAQPEEISKAFRLQARRYHPDRSRDNTKELFQAINNAYQILSNEHTRKAYDQYLNDPQAYRFQQYYGYYKAYYMPQTNPFFVLFIFFVLVSLLQYRMRVSMHNSAVQNILHTDRIKDMVNQKYWAQATPQMIKKAQKSKRELVKQDLKKLPNYKDKEDIKQQIRNQISIAGGLAPPKITDILIVRIFLLPWTLTSSIYVGLAWFIKYGILRKQYSDKDKQKITMQRLKISKSKWDAIDAAQKSQIMSKQLWIKQKFKEYQQQMTAQQKQQEKQFMNSTRYKQYMRYMKKNG